MGHPIRTRHIYLVCASAVSLKVLTTIRPLKISQVIKTSELCNNSMKYAGYSIDLYIFISYSRY